MKIISFDPAAKKNLGIAVITTGRNKKIKRIKAYTEILPPAEDHERAWLMFRLLDDLLLKEKPKEVVLERSDIFAGSKYIRCLISKCITVIECACSKHEVEITELTPSTIKKMVTGSGRANKEQVQSATKDFLSKIGISNNYDSEHAYDAVATGLGLLMKKGIF